MKKVQTILLVDDEPAVLQELIHVFRKEPFRVICARSGPEALELLKREAVDVVVSDDDMPGMRGTEFLSLLRKIYPSIIRIILTGRVTTRSALCAIHDGWVYKYLHKPCPPDQLKAAIRLGLIAQSLLLENEAPHLMMTSEEQVELLQKVSAKN